ncbi:MAG: hypothetical protein FJX54_21480 [Alphaproteobacteria bacterium]|nr:hypothetical protein [Alphaproteobacteria bacterium]
MTEAPTPKTPQPPWPLIARALGVRGDHAGALAAWRKQAIEVPSDAAAWTVIALTLADRAQAEAALLPAGAVAALRPDLSESHGQLGAIRALAGRRSMALTAFRRALTLTPGDARTRSRFGHVLADGGDLDLPYVQLNRALALDAGDALAWRWVAQRRTDMLDFDGAERSLKRGIAAAPSHPLLLAPLAELRRDQGEITPALRLYDRIVAIEPSIRNERACLLALLYEPEANEAMRFSRHLAYARRYAPERPRPPRRPVTGSRIHVAYLSSGFFDHPTAAVTVRLIEAHNRQGFEVSLFAHVQNPDAMSRRLEAASDHWVDVRGWPHERIAEAIRAAGVDILVVLAGRYDPIAWPVAALRPAAVQIAFHDTATAGMTAIDHLVTDAILSPRQAPERAVERYLRLPSFPMHELPSDVPVVAPLPALGRGYVTFGSLNNSAKLNDRVLSLWARCLAAVPGSRLLLKAPMLASRRMRERIGARFAEAGVAHDRLELISGYLNSHRDLLSLYDRFDIGLDTFPYSGGMTTFEAMCQGVPVVTLADRFMVGRWGATLAIHAGHPDLVAATEDEFVAIACRLVGDLPALAGRRARLRQDFLSSPLCDARLKARHLERAYRRMMRGP